MKPRVAIAALVATAAWVTLSHFGWEKSDNGVLLLVDGRAVDAQGWLSDRLTRLQRDCRHVTRLQLDDERLLATTLTLKAYSPPDSDTARITAAWTAGPWMLVEVAFDKLLPAVVLMKQADSGWRISPEGIWSGQTHPWVAAPLIRNYLASRAPDVPDDLLACFEPTTSLMDFPLRKTD
jgi:hypothetical protein